MREKSGWSKMRAEQWFSGLSPAFVWHATVRPIPVLWIEGRDSLLRGKGSMIIRLLSVLTVVDERGHEMNVSSLIRYGSEIPWFPTALRPSERLSWEGIDDKSARATFREGDLSVSMVFTFNEQNEIVRLDTDDRFDDKHQKHHWTVYYRGYKDVAGYRIPTEGEAAWKTPDGEFVYIKLKVTEIDYSVPSS